MIKSYLTNDRSKTYMILNLLDYSVSYLDEVPNDGWNDEFKTIKLVLRNIPAGSFIMGSPQNELGRKIDETQHKVFLTKSFYIGVFQITQMQYELIAGYNPSIFYGEMRPVENISYDMIRGKNGKGMQWPLNNEVDDDSFLGKLRAKLNLNFDLPTEAQWEYACRGGTIRAWNNDTEISNYKICHNLDNLGRYFNNLYDGKGAYSEHTKVGSYLPNNYGLYDMHGNVWEWCLDWAGLSGINEDTKDPLGLETAEYRVLRGGSWYDYANRCRSACRGYYFPDIANFDNGFRIVLV